jgi:hypothetical protein
MDQPNVNVNQGVPMTSALSFNQVPMSPVQQPQQNGNPLARHFRQPMLYIKLTSNGKYWPEGAVELTATGELPVFAMTAKDEIILRTPDALINGTSVVEVMQSCCPGIKDAWKMPSVDVDSTLIAIRIASYGNMMPVSAKCPHCGEEHDYDISLQQVREKIQMPNYGDPINTRDGLIIKLRPMNYMQVSKAGNVAFEEERLVQALANPDLSADVRNSEYNKHVQKMIDLNVDNVTNCTEVIIADGVEVRDAAFIREFYQNADGSTIKLVENKIKALSEVVNIKPEDATCTDCGKDFKLNIEFDYTRFFANGS